MPVKSQRSGTRGSLATQSAETPRGGMNRTGFCAIRGQIWKRCHWRGLQGESVPRHVSDVSPGEVVTRCITYLNNSTTRIMQPLLLDVSRFVKFVDFCLESAINQGRNAVCSVLCRWLGCHHASCWTRAARHLSRAVEGGFPAKNNVLSWTEKTQVIN